MKCSVYWRGSAMAFSLSLCLMNVPVWGQVDVKADLKLSSSVVLEEPIDFMVSTAWWPGAEGDRPGILALNAKESTTKLVTIDGGVHSFDSFQEKKADQRILSIDEMDGGYYQLSLNKDLETFQARLFTRNRSLLVASNFEKLFENLSDSKFVPFTPYDFHIAENHLIGYGPYSTRTDRLYDGVGFFTYALAEPRPGFGRLLNTMAVDQDYYKLGFSYIASIGSKVFFIPMTDAPELHRFDLYSDVQPIRLGYLPMGDRALPPLTVGREIGIEETMKGVGEISGFPMDLFEHEGDLYCLTRGRASDGDPKWSLDRIELGDDEALAVSEYGLPSSAELIRVVPTPDSLYILEMESGTEKISKLAAVGWP